MLMTPANLIKGGEFFKIQIILYQRILYFWFVDKVYYTSLSVITGSVRSSCIISLLDCMDL